MSDDEVLAAAMLVILLNDKKKEDEYGLKNDWKEGQSTLTKGF